MAPTKNKYRPAELAHIWLKLQEFMRKTPRYLVKEEGWEIFLVDTAKGKRTDGSFKTVMEAEILMRKLEREDFDKLERNLNLFNEGKLPPVNGMILESLLKEALKNADSVPFEPVPPPKPKGPAKLSLSQLLEEELRATGLDVRVTDLGGGEASPYGTCGHEDLLANTLDEVDYMSKKLMDLADAMKNGKIDEVTSLPQARILYKQAAQELRGIAEATQDYVAQTRAKLDEIG